MANQQKLATHPHALTWWYGLMALGGAGFGLIGERRPFGPGFFAHPLVVFFIIVGGVLLALRFATESRSLSSLDIASRVRPPL